jgi:putative membrane protein
VSEEPADFREWTRAHSVTPFINAFQGFVAIGVAFLILLPSGAGDPDVPKVPAIVFWGFLLIGVVVVGFSFLAWRVNEYRIGDDAVYQRKGIVFRQHRKARLDRLQAVDVIQPLVARIFGFAETKIEVAGGAGSTVSLRFLKLEDAENLRNEVLALAAGYTGEAVSVDSPTPPTAPTPGQEARESGVWSAPQAGTSVEREAVPAMSTRRSRAVPAVERRVYEVPLGRLIGSIIVSWTFVAVVLMAALVGLSMVWLNETEGTSNTADGSTAGGITSSAFALIGIGAILWGQLNANANFSAGIAADGVRLSHGLLEVRHQTVPPGRVQALNIKQSLPWKGFDWWRITINVAGYQDQRENVSTLLPVGTRQQALDALWLVLPDLGDPDPAGTISTAMDGKGDENGFTASPARSWVFDPFQWRRRGVKATERALLIRRGLFVKEFFVVPHERTQSLAIRQGPLQRLLRLATIEVHSTRGAVKPVAGHLDLEDARAFIHDQSRRARESRKRQTPEQWMEAVTS